MKKTTSSLYLLAGQFVPIVKDLGANPALNKAMTDADLASFLNSGFKIAVIVGAMLAVARIGYGGFLYMGSDSWTNKSRAKEVLVDAVTGLVILLAIVLILQYINPNILKLNLTPGKVSTPTSGTTGGAAPAAAAAEVLPSPFASPTGEPLSP